MENSEIKRRIKAVLGDMFDQSPEDFQDAKPFSEMAKYDSMRALEFLAKVEGEFNVQIDPDQLPNMATVERAAQVVEGLLRGN